MSDTNTTTTNDLLGSVRAQLQQRLALLDDEGDRIRKALQLLNGSGLSLLQQPAAVIASSASDVATDVSGRTRRTKGARKDKNAARKAKRDAARAAITNTTRPTRAEQPRLVDWVRDVLAQGEPLDGTTISERVLAAGYRTTSANFRQVVHMALTKSDSFKRNGAGLWTLSAKGAK